MQNERRVAANPQTKPIVLGCESAENWQLYVHIHRVDEIRTFQGWVFATAKTIFAGTVEKTGKNRGKN